MRWCARCGALLLPFVRGQFCVGCETVSAHVERARLLELRAMVRQAARSDWYGVTNHRWMQTSQGVQCNQTWQDDVDAAVKRAEQRERLRGDTEGWGE